MTRRTAAGALGRLHHEEPKLAGTAAWILRSATEGCEIVGTPRGLNPRKATPWSYELLQYVTRAGVRQVGMRHAVAEKVVLQLVNAGLVKGKPGSDAKGNPEIRFAATEQGCEQVEKLRLSGAFDKPGQK